MDFITEKDRKAEEKDFAKIEKMIQKKDKKALDKWTRAYNRGEKKYLKDNDNWL